MNNNKILIYKKFLESKIEYIYSALEVEKF